MVRTRFLLKEHLMRPIRPDQGFTLVEVLVSTAVSAIALGSLLIAYDLVDKQYTKIRDTTVIGQTGRNVLKIMERDIRMAGSEWWTPSGTVEHGAITDADAISITQGAGNGCCDEVTVIYDRQKTNISSQRLRIRYWVRDHAGTRGTRSRLFKKTDIIAPPSQVKVGAEDAMADYIEDLQLEYSGSAAHPKKLIEIYLALRTKQEFSREKSYQRGAHYPGDSTLETTDRFRRREFSTSVAVRNLTL
ncbi:MAG: prepilin-type N-terminal cleavage/methylation domain-containing protein [Acidiferrobacteraceae bacterium]|jgi:prepilin-type N-terminal cleavage/methylation domain-containing protein|nr:prepilin-type N-terminal cleavage/methylation domain-containing protein [Acidiferrobacteraceae bacterium]